MTTVGTAVGNQLDAVLGSLPVFGPDPDSSKVGADHVSAEIGGEPGPTPSEPVASSPRVPARTYRTSDYNPYVLCQLFAGRKPGDVIGRIRTGARVNKVVVFNPCPPPRAVPGLWAAVVITSDRSNLAIAEPTPVYDGATVVGRVPAFEATDVFDARRRASAVLAQELSKARLAQSFGKLSTIYEIYTDGAGGMLVARRDGRPMAEEDEAAFSAVYGELAISASSVHGKYYTVVMMKPQ